MGALQILLLANSPAEAERIEAALTAGGLVCQSLRILSRTLYVAALRGETPDLILAGSGPQGLGTREARALARCRRPEVPFVVVPAVEEPSASADESTPMPWLVPAILQALHEVHPEWRTAALLGEVVGEWRFRALVETLPHLIWAARRGGRCSQVNDRWTQYTGLSAARSQDQGWLEAIVAADREAWQCAWVQADATGQPFRVECRLRCQRDGTARWHLARALPVRAHDGSITSWVGTFTDIDRSKRHEAELQASARQHAALAELGQRAMEGLEPLLLMAEVVAHLVQVLGVDHAAVFELGGDSQEPCCLVHLGIGGVMADVEARVLIEQALEAGRPVAISGLAEVRDPSAAETGGSRTPVTYGMATPIPGPGRPTGVLCATSTRLRPMTAEELHFLHSTAHLIASAQARHRAANELRAARDAAESASRAKDQLLALLSHELRTPLAPIMLAVSAMQDDPATRAEQRSVLAMIHRNVELESHLIDDLLDVSQILGGKLPYDWTVADAQGAIIQALALTAQEFRAAGLRLIVDFQAETRQIRADPARLQQLLRNLVHNAIKFTPIGGTVTLQTRNEPDPNGAADRLEITIQDTGIGIDPTLLTRIFDPFEQGEGVYTRKFEGLGLGLTISRALAEAHGGRLSAYSAGRGQGSTFTLSLPTVAIESTLTVDRDGTASGSLARVLLIDDDRATLNVTARLLRLQGYQVTTASDLASALSAAEKDPHQIVVSDIGLPDGSGYDLMSQLRARHGVPGIAVTGGPLDADRARVAGFIEQLTKPITIANLDAAIRRVLATVRAAASSPETDPLPLVGSAGAGESEREFGSPPFTLGPSAGLDPPDHRDRQAST